MSDFYRVLGVEPGASQDEIKVAFRKLALLHHPDRHTNAARPQQEEAAARFKAITEAYDVLTDDRKRAQYEASVRYGGSSGYGASYGGGGARGRYYSYADHNVNTDWAHSRYSQTAEHARARISWFQQLQRAVGARKLEAALTLAGVGLLLFGGNAVEAIWTARNQGKSFGDMQAARRASTVAGGTSGGRGARGGSGGASADGAGGGAEAAAAPAGGSRRPKPYSPAVGCTSRHSPASSLLSKQQRLTGALLSESGQRGRLLAEMPLAEFLAEEERACRQQQQQEQEGQQEGQQLDPQQGGKQEGPQEGQQRQQGKKQGQDQGQDQGQAQGQKEHGQGRGYVYVDRAVVLPAPSPPGQMAGHRPPAVG
ncbi:hypothetical protein PLESTM_000890700 [Pleodorina starrii]|nr:hypothetical protein PLESTM_000890700 [Pleodorina starrii]